MILHAARRVDIFQDMEETTDKERQAAIDLGTNRAWTDLFRRKLFKDVKSEVRVLYFQSIPMARNLGIHLQDPPDETTADDEMETFFIRHDTHVQECITKIGNPHITRLFYTSYYITCLRMHVRIKCDNRPDQNVHELNEDIQHFANQLQRFADTLDVDLSEELEKAKNAKQGEELDEITTQIMEKLQIPKRSQNKQSEIDPTRIIMDEYWVVSLVRIPDSSHSEHAFLVVEGKSGNKSMIWFADFVAKNPSDLLLQGMRDGQVRVDYHESNEGPDSSSQLLFQGRRTMMKIQSAYRLLHSSWQIPKSTAETLIKKIEAQEANPPKYNILGNSMLAAGCAMPCSNDTGHNCFTFARKMLLDLNDVCIKIPQGTLEKWIYSATSRALVDKQHKSWNTPTFAVVSALAFLAGVTTAYFILKVL